MIYQWLASLWSRKIFSIFLWHTEGQCWSAMLRVYPRLQLISNESLNDIVSSLEFIILVSTQDEERKVDRDEARLWAREWTARKAHSLSDFLWLLCLWLHRIQTWHSGCLWHMSSENISLYLLSLSSSLGIVSWCNFQHLQMCLVLVKRTVKEKKDISIGTSS